jgi:hypothetical protein
MVAALKPWEEIKVVRKPEKAKNAEDPPADQESL